MQKLVKAISAKTEQGRLLERHLSPLTTIFAELFKNRHQHARYWWDQRDIDSSVRGLYARYYRASELEAESHAADGPTQLYLDSVFSTPSLGRRGAMARPRPQGCFELTVFDAGPGLAQKWLGRDTSDDPIDVEYKAVLECFDKGRSSLPEPGRGFGLSKVLNIVRARRGFIRVRTNRLHLYRQYETLPDYGMEELPGGGRAPREKLLDWRKGFSERPSEFEPI